MTTERRRPTRIVRRYSNGELFDTVEKGTVTPQFVADLVWLGEDVSIYDEKTREDRTEVLLAPLIFSRLRKTAGAALTVEGVALARAITALKDVRAEFERLNTRIAGLESLLQDAIRSRSSPDPVDADREQTRGNTTGVDPLP
jgi:hypothetical protein